MIVSIDNKTNELVVRIPMQAATLSQSGKSFVIASSGGGEKTDLLIDGRQVTVNLTAWYPAGPTTAKRGS